jgi:hypothetical protein
MRLGMILSAAILLALSGCAGQEVGMPLAAPLDVGTGPEGAAPVAAAPPAGAQTAAALDTTTAAQKAAALAAPPPAGERSLGQAAVSLGNPAEPGFWLRGGLVSVAGKGRVVTAGGQSVAVDLIPGEGAAQLSLPAFRALGLALTDLPQVTVFAQ